jgi:peroxiredoxin
MAESYYSLLNIAPEATSEEISAAYERQRQRYSAEHVTTLDADMQRVASQRTAELDRAYATLTDPERRRAYDRALGEPESPAAVRQRSGGLSRREVLMAAAGAAIGLLLITIVWIFAGRSAPAELPPVAEVNRPSTDFTLTSLDGTPVSLSDFRGKVVMLNFWYTGCEPCREETPALQAVYQKLADQGLVVLGVNVRTNERSGPDGDADVRAFTSRYGVTYPIVFDRDGGAGRDYQVLVLPTSLFIDSAGTVRYARFSAVTAEEVEQIFSKLQRDTTALR